MLKRARPRDAQATVFESGSPPHPLMAKSIPRTIDYIEIPSKDIVRSRAFFTELLGWTFTDYGPDYTSFEDGRINGGFFASEKISSQKAGGVLPVIYAEGLENAKSD